MNIGKICNREVVNVNRTTSLLEAGKIMRDQHVGSLVITEKKNGAQLPQGIVTDRDILMQVLAKGVALEKISVEDIMTSPLITARENEDLNEIIQTMKQKGIRRLPVVNAKGHLTGIIAMDDILPILAEEIKGISNITRIACEHEALTRP